MRSLLKRHSCFAASASRPGFRRSEIALLVSGAALMAGCFIRRAGAVRRTKPDPLSIRRWRGNALTPVMSTVNTAFLTSGSAFVTTPGGAAHDTQSGTGDTKARSSLRGTISTADTLVGPTTPANAPASSNCQTKVRRDFGGFQAGRDLAVYNFGGNGANLHSGTTVGYVQANISDITPAIGPLTGNFQEPFAAVYAAFTKGGFYADRQARFEYYRGQLNDPVANGIYNQRLDARAYTLTGLVSDRGCVSGRGDPEIPGALAAAGLLRDFAPRNGNGSKLCLSVRI